MLVDWDEVPEEQRNGEIQGYRVLYKDSNGAEKKIKVDALTKQTSLTGLKKSTVYNIKVLAFNSVGDGPATPSISVTTSEDSKCKRGFYIKTHFNIEIFYQIVINEGSTQEERVIL